LLWNFSHGWGDALLKPAIALATQATVFLEGAQHVEHLVLPRSHGATPEVRFDFQIPWATNGSESLWLITQRAIENANSRRAFTGAENGFACSMPALAKH
jgi:hypothetical protein